MLKSFKKRFKALERGQVGQFGNDLSSPQARRLAHWHFHLFDHAFLRVVWTNMSEIAPGVWRSNQPSPARVARYAKMGIKTILTLRGNNNLSYSLFEREACAKHGIKLVPIALTARSALEKEKYLALIDLFDELERPLLFHCKSGADRAGLASALYLLHVENVPLDVAKRQLHWRFAHLKSTKTGVLDHILDAYGADLEKHGPIPIRDWFENYYDRDEVRATFKPRWSSK